MTGRPAQDRDRIDHAIQVASWLGALAMFAYGAALSFDVLHTIAQARSIQDTSRAGRYHNRRYATLAGELGLDVTSVKPIGWSATSVPEQTAGLYAGQLEELAAALVLWRRLEAPATAGTRSRNLLACSCPCGRKLRAAKATLAEAPILCGACDQPFHPDDADDGN